MSATCIKGVPSNGQASDTKEAFRFATPPSLDKMIPVGLFLGRELEPELAELKPFDPFESESKLSPLVGRGLVVIKVGYGWWRLSRDCTVDC